VNGFYSGIFAAGGRQRAHRTQQTMKTSHAADGADCILLPIG